MSVLLSIIIPTFNSAETLDYCLESLSNQTSRNFEVLILDGVSKDNTVELAEKYRSTLPELTVICEPDKGIYDAMNKGIALAKGEWLYFLGSDDCLFESSTLEKVFRTKNIDNLQVIYGNVLFKHNKKIYDGRFSSLKLHDRNICHQSIFYRKSVFEKFGNYELKYVTVADWVLNIKWFNSKLCYSYINLNIAIYNEDGFSNNTPDNEFINNQDRIKRDNFPFWATMIIKLKNVKIVRRTLNFIKRKFN